MRFALPEDAVAVRDGLRAVLEAECPPSVVRAAWDDDGGRSAWRPLWATLGALGVPGLLLPEALGGLGCDEVLLAAAVEELGYAAAPGPFVETTAVVVPLLGAAGDPTGSLGELLAGQLVATCRIGAAGTSAEALLVPYAQQSDLFLLAAGGIAQLLRSDEVTVEAVSTVDASRRCGLVTARAGTRATTLELDPATVATAAARATLATAAALIGLSARMLQMTTSYVRERRQFGVPVGSFQAVKHQLADALVAVEFARPAMLHAAWSMSRQETGADCHLSMAKAMAGDAASRVARTAIQCHGAMGYTVEYDLHLFVKRAWALAADWGSADEHIGRVARALWSA